MEKELTGDKFSKVHALKNGGGVHWIGCLDSIRAGSRGGLTKV